MLMLSMDLVAWERCGWHRYGVLGRLVAYLVTETDLEERDDGVDQKLV